MITIKNNELEVKIKPLGAELQSIKDTDGVEYLWQGNPEFWGGRATNLFPFVGRLTEGHYTFEGEKYPMGSHGFCRGNEFDVIKHLDTCVEFYLDSNEELKKVYPFEFRFSIIYTLVGSKLEINYKVVNKDGKTMYFAVGGHPGFNVPLADKGQFEDYYLQFDEKCKAVRMGTSETCFMNGENTPYPLMEEDTLKLSHDLYDEDAIILKDMSNMVTLKNKVGAPEIEVGYPEMKYLATWHAVKKAAPYVCIEPWTTLPSRDGVLEDISTHNDMNVLEAGKTYENKWWVRVVK